MKVKAKKCKGTGQATNSGCGREVLKRIYGLCEPCYYDWLLNTEAGKIKLAKSTLQGKKNYEKKNETEKKDERRSLNIVKQSLKSHSEWMNDLQKVFNAYIRLRDKDKPCVSCGTFRGQMHCGHYMAVSIKPQLRFNEFNAAKQCARCNNYLSANLINYRIELVKRIGLEKVEELEHDNTVQKLTIPEIKEKIKYYKKNK